MKKLIDFDKEGFKKEVITNVKTLYRRPIEEATPQQVFQAVSYAVKDDIIDRWIATHKEYEKKNVKTVYYLSMEFLMGRALGNNLINLTYYDAVKEALDELGFDLNLIEDQEPDAALGNGGLGRLAACFLDSLATLGYPAYGCGIRYRYGMFKQAIKDGYQIELPDDWLKDGNPFEIKRPEYAVEVKFGGYVRVENRDGRNYFIQDGYQTVRAVPYDVPVVGYGNNVVNTLRIWDAEAINNFNLDSFDKGEYEKAVQACDSVLEDSRYVLFNMNGQEPTASFTKLATSEIIFSQGGYTTPQQSAYFLKTYFFGCSSVLRDLYIDKDLRKKIFFKESSSGRAITYSNKIGVNDVKPVSDWGMIRLAEVFLNKAEAQALLGNESDAINTLQDLQKMRYSEIPEFAGSGLELIEFIRTERRLELCFEGHRWFDLRRYSVCPKYPSTQEIIHVVHEYTTREVPTEIYKLAAYNVDNRGWVLPIPGYTITFNGVIMIQNEREESKKYEYIASEHEKYD